MMPENNIDRLLGGLAAQVEALNAKLDAFDARASEHRNRLYAKAEDIEREVSAVSARTAAAEAAITDMKPTVDVVRAWKQRGIGLLAGVGLAGTGLGAAIYSLWEKMFPPPGG